MKSKKTSSFILEMIAPFKWLIAGQFLVCIIWGIDLSLRPYILKTILDKITVLTPSLAYEAIKKPAYLYIFLTFFIVLAFRFLSYVCLKIYPPLKKNINTKMMNIMMDQSHDFYQNQFAGSISNKIKEVMDSVGEVVQIIIHAFFSHSFAIIIAIFTLWHARPEFAYGLIFWAVFYIFITLKLSKKSQHLTINAAEVRAKMFGHIVDLLGNISSLRLYNGKKIEQRNLNIILDNHVEAEQRREWYFLKIFGIQGFSFALYQGIIIIWLIHNFKQGKVTPGDFTLILTINISIMDILWSVAQDINRFVEKIGNINLGLEIINQPIKIKDTVEAKPLIAASGAIKFNSVSFGYNDSNLLFDKLNIEIKPGEKVGLVGYSGSGKTTFVNLIMRLFDPVAGNIFIDDQNIKDITIKSLRKNISFVPQDPALFNRSVYDNIIYSRPKASELEVIEAAEAAGAAKFITNLSEGYDTLVGEKGTKLSGGERQRLSIARAYLKTSSILILDEATSALDSITENEIGKALGNLMINKTCLVIAHRLSTILNMDRILVFDKGKIIEQGSHAQLLSTNSLYKQLWSAQAGGFLPN